MFAYMRVLKTLKAYPNKKFHIDENLTRSSHIDYLCSHIASKISLLQQLATDVPTNGQKLFYQSYILPYIDYSSVILDATSGANIERLNKFQKRAVRTCIDLHANYDTCLSIKVSPVPDKINYNRAILTYRAIIYVSPEFISNLSKIMSDSHTLNLRSSACSKGKNFALRKFLSMFCT